MLFTFLNLNLCYLVRGTHLCKPPIGSDFCLRRTSKSRWEEQHKMCQSAGTTTVKPGAEQDFSSGMHLLEVHAPTTGASVIASIIFVLLGVLIYQCVRTYCRCFRPPVRPPPPSPIALATLNAGRLTSTDDSTDFQRAQMMQQAQDLAALRAQLATLQMHALSLQRDRESRSPHRRRLALPEPEPRLRLDHSPRRLEPPRMQPGDRFQALIHSSGTPM